MRNTDRNPAWVAKAYADAQSMLFEENHPHRDRLRQVIFELATTNSSELARAWKSVAKCFDARYSNMTPEQHVYEVAESCLAGLDGFQGHESTPAKELHDKAKGIAIAARNLKKGLQSLDHPYFGLAPAVSLSAFAWSIVVEGNDEMNRLQSRSAEWNDGYAAGAFGFSEAVARQWPHILQLLADGAHDLASYRQMIAKPTTKEAARTYFIKTLGGFFIYQYRELLPAAVLAFTSIFFEIDGMKTKSITEIMRYRDRSQNRSGNQ